MAMGVFASTPRLVLVVDDEEDITTTLKTLLEHGLAGTEVRTASSGQAGLEILRTARIDLVLTDYRMPGMNGLEFMEKAAKVAPDVPRILLTAFPDVELALMALQEHHVAHFFRKPFDPGEVTQVVRAILDKSFSDAQRADAFRRSLALARRRPGSPHG